MRPPLLDEILRRGTVEGANGKFVPVANHVKPMYLGGLYDVARGTEPRLIIEVGMCYGITSLVLAQALADTAPDGRLISIDPFETEAWCDIGRLNVERSGLPVRLDVHVRQSYFVLPELLAAGESADFVFVDGNHTRDYVRTDTFFAHRLLRAGGVLGLDDTPDVHIRRLCHELLTDYHYEEVVPVLPLPWNRRLRRRLAAAIGRPRHARVRYFRKLDDHEPG